LAIALERLGADPIEAVAPIRVCLKHAALWGACVCSVALPPVRRNGKTAVAFPRCQEALNFADVLLRRLRLEAEAAGVPLALEAAAGGCLLSPVELRELIDGACSWAVGACLDWTTVTRVGDFADWCETLARRVHCVRIPADQGRGPGEEAKRLADHVQNVLDRIAYPGPVVVRDVVGG
jgi:sugar phosphate isomerase/epimerase